MDNGTISISQNLPSNEINPSSVQQPVLSQDELYALKQLAERNKKGAFRLAIIFFLLAVVISVASIVTKSGQVLIFAAALVIISAFELYRYSKEPNSNNFINAALPPKLVITGNWSMIFQKSGNGHRDTVGFLVEQHKFIFINSTMQPMSWLQLLGSYTGMQLTVTYSDLYPMAALQIFANGQQIYNILSR